MQAMVPSGIPGTTIDEGRARNGNGISEPISTSGRHAASRRALSDSARNTMGGMPTPPPTRSVRGRAGEGTKPRPIGPSVETVAPSGCCESAARPGPTTL